MKTTAIKTKVLMRFLIVFFVIVDFFTHLRIISNVKSVSSNEQNHGEANADIQLGRSSEASLFGASFLLFLRIFPVFNF